MTQEEAAEIRNKLQPIQHLIAEAPGDVDPELVDDARLALRELLRFIEEATLDTRTSGDQGVVRTTISHKAADAVLNGNQGITIVATSRTRYTVEATREALGRLRDEFHARGGTNGEPGASVARDPNERAALRRAAAALSKTLNNEAGEGET